MPVFDDHHSAWAKPRDDWFDYFVDPKRYTVLLENVEENRCSIEDLAIQFATQALQYENDERVLLAKGMLPTGEDIAFVQRKAASLWLCSMAAFASLGYDFERMLAGNDVLSVKPLIDCIYKMFRNPELTKDSTFGDYLIERWTMSIDQRYRIPPPQPKQTVNNPAAVADSVLMRHENVRLEVVNIRKRLGDVVLATERIAADGKLLFVPGPKCFLKPFLEHAVVSLNVGLDGFNVLYEGTPRPQLALECSAIPAKDVANRARADLVAHYFSDGNLSKVKEHLSTIAAPSSSHSLVAINMAKIGGYFCALRLKSPFPLSPNAIRPNRIDADVLNDDNSLDRKLSIRRNRAAIRTTNENKAAFVIDNIAHDMIEGIRPVVRHLLKDKPQIIAILKAILRLLPRFDMRDRRRVLGQLYYLCATVAVSGKTMRDLMLEVGFSAVETRPIASPSLGPPPAFPDPKTIKKLLFTPNTSNGLWNLLMSFDCDEIRQILPTLPDFQFPVTKFKFPELLGGVLKHTSRSTTEFYVAVVVKMHQLVQMKDVQRCQALGNSLGGLGQEFQPKMILDAISTSACVLNKGIYYPWVVHNQTTIGQTIKLAKSAYIKLEQKGGNLSRQVSAALLNCKEFDFCLLTKPTQDKATVIASLVSAIIKYTDDIPRRQMTLKGYHDFIRRIFDSDVEKRKESDDKRERQKEASDRRHKARESAHARHEITLFLRCIKETTTLSFLISHFAFLFNMALLNEKKPTLKIFCEKEEWFDGLTTRMEKPNIESIEECLRIVLENGLRVEPTNPNWLRILADYKYASSECPRAAQIYLETIFAAQPDLTIPFNHSNILNETLFGRLRVCLNQMGLHTMAALVCQFILGERRIEELESLARVMDTQQCVDASSQYGSLVFEPVLAEFLSTRFELKEQVNHVDRLLYWLARPGMNVANGKIVYSREQSRRAERLLRQLASLLFEYQI